MARDSTIVYHYNENHVYLMSDNIKEFYISPIDSLIIIEPVTQNICMKLTTPTMY